MRLFMIDLENIHSPGIEGCEKLSSTDKVIIFYSKHANQLLIPQVLEILRTKAQVEFQEASVGTANALDFQLVFHLGVAAGRFRGKELAAYVVSKDRGYDCVGEYVEKNLQIENVQIYRTSSIQAVLDMAKETAAKKAASVQEKKAELKDAQKDEQEKTKELVDEILDDSVIVESKGEPESVSGENADSGTTVSADEKDAGPSSDSEEDDDRAWIRERVFAAAKKHNMQPQIVWESFRNCVTKEEFYQDLLKWFRQAKTKKLYAEIKKLFEEAHQWQG